MTTAVTRIPDRAEWDTLVALARVLSASGVVPRHATKPEAAIAIILQGRELGVGPMQALRTIYLIEGKVTLSADLMAALIYSRHGDNSMRVVERTAEQCVIDYKRPEWAEPARMTWTMKQARDAGLTGKDNWKKYPEAMLYARCISAIAHTCFQDTIMGLYLPDEVEEMTEAVPVTATTVVTNHRALPAATPSTHAGYAGIDNHGALVLLARQELKEAAVRDPKQWSPAATRSFINKVFSRTVRQMDDLNNEELTTLIGIWQGRLAYDYESGQPLPDSVIGNAVEPDEGMDAIAEEPPFADESDLVNEGAEDSRAAVANW